MSGIHELSYCPNTYHLGLLHPWHFVGLTPLPFHILQRSFSSITDFSFLEAQYPDTLLIVCSWLFEIVLWCLSSPPNVSLDNSLLMLGYFEKLWISLQTKIQKEPKLVQNVMHPQSKYLNQFKICFIQTEKCGPLRLSHLNQTKNVKTLPVSTSLHWLFKLQSTSTN